MIEPNKKVEIGICINAGVVHCCLHVRRKNCIEFQAYDPKTETFSMIKPND